MNFEQGQVSGREHVVQEMGVVPILVYMLAVVIHLSEKLVVLLEYVMALDY